MRWDRNKTEEQTRSKTEMNDKHDYGQRKAWKESPAVLRVHHVYVSCSWWWLRWKKYREDDDDFLGTTGSYTWFSWCLNTCFLHLSLWGLFVPLLYALLFVWQSQTWQQPGFDHNFRQKTYHYRRADDFKENIFCAWLLHSRLFKLCEKNRWRRMTGKMTSEQGRESKETSMSR